MKNKTYSQSGTTAAMYRNYGLLYATQWLVSILTTLSYIILKFSFGRVF